MVQLVQVGLEDPLSRSIAIKKLEEDTRTIWKLMNRCGWFFSVMVVRCTTADAQFFDNERHNYSRYHLRPHNIIL